MNNIDKQGLRNSTVAIKSKIIVKATADKPEIVLTDNNSIKDWEYTDDRYVPQQGFIGQFVARTLSGNLQDISDDFNIENREIELQLAIVHLEDDSESWYSLGNFLITNPEGDEVRDNTKFEAMDYAKLFNKTFDGSYTDAVFTISYNTKMENKETVTALWLAQYVCAQVDIELGNTDFVNSDYVIDINPFRNNETCRDVIKEVAKLAYSWVRIDWDNKCYIDFSVRENSSVDEYDIFTSDHYYTLETKKEKYGPINNVVVGMSNVDGESHSNPDNNSIAQNGEHAIYIYDNPLTYTFEHRERANARGNCLFGLSYAHMTCETIGFPWLRGNELISILDMENNPIYTYPFNKKITFNGHIKSTIDSMGESEVEETLAYESNVVKNARNAFINVNKQEGEINILSQNIQNVEKEINPPENASGSEIIVEDASNNPLLYLEVEGKSTQETRSGYNCYINSSNLTQGASDVSNAMETLLNYEGYDKVIHIKQAVAYATLLNNILNDYYIANVVAGSSITCMWLMKIPSGITPTVYVTNNTTTYYTSLTKYKEAGNGWAYYYATYTFKDTATSFTLSPHFKTEISGEVYVAKMQVTVGSEIKDFEEYGASPSPDYPSGIESVGYDNKFDKNNVTLNKYIEPNGVEVTSSLSSISNYCNVNENTNYLINYGTIESYWKVVCFYDRNKTFLSYLQVTDESSITKFITPNNCKYLRFHYYTANLDEVYLIEGTQEHNYIPYGKYGIEVKTVGKNRWDNKNATTTSTVLNVTDTGFNYERGAETGGRYFANKFNLKANKTYTFSILDNSNVPLYIYKDNVYGTSLKSGYNSITYTPSEDVEVYATIIIGSGVTSAIVEEIQFEEGDTKTEYTLYQNNKSLMILNSPLKSIPNGVKDIAYIKNNRLYVDHYVGSEVFDGSEDWWLHTGNQFRLQINGIRGGQRQLSTHFRNSFGTEIGCIVAYQDDYLRVFANFTTLDEFKSWLSTNNVQVDYELVEPYTEEIGEIDTLKTLLGYNKITTTDDLQPTLNITYVRDTVLADYVENHIAELKINEEQISQRVETIDTSVDGLQTDISRVEQITTDTSQVLNIVSTHIDKTTGDVREVTTTTGFTFNKDGMEISDGSGFKGQHTAQGTFYKDGDTIVGQYTKDGSKQKDLELFGTYSYGKTDIDDTPMFVAQLYEDENGEECFGHFYNGGDY